MRIRKYKTELMDDTRIPFLVMEESRYFSECDYSMLNSPENIVDVMNKVFHLDRQTEEYVYLICMTAKCKPIGFFEVSHGGIDSSILEPRGVLQKALLCNAKNLVIVHNHPSGNSEPSGADISISTRIEESCKLMGISLVDSIVIGNHEFTSLKAIGVIG